MSAARNSAQAARGLAFLAGVGFAAVPAAGPFLALLTWFSQRLQFQRADRLWWAAAALLSLPFILTGHAVAGLATSAQVLAAWLLFRSATALRERLKSVGIGTELGAGLVVGLLIAFLVGLRQLDGFDWATARTPLDAITWQTHPTTFGHMMLVLATLLAIVVPSPGLRVVALTLGAAGVVMSGAWEAIFAWLLVAIGLRLVRRRGTRATHAAEWALIAVMGLLASGLLAPLGVGRTGFLTAFQPEQETSNVFRGTEVADGDWWFPLGVTFTQGRMAVEGIERTSFTVTKRSSDPWSRLQQIVTLEPGQTYTMSAVLRYPADARPGLDGWGETTVDGESVQMNVGTTLVNGVHEARGTGPVEIMSSSALELEDGLVRAQVTFRYDGDQPLTWHVGVVPDRSNLTGLSTTFAELQLTATDAPVPYIPGRAERGVASLRASRYPVWGDAIDAIAARPLVGWGAEGLPRSIEALSGDQPRLRPVASHAHNIALSIWVERGLVGLAGLLVLILALSLRAVQQRDKAAAVVLLGVFVLNTFDSTLLSGAILYPLAAVLGWRAVGHRPLAKAETGVLSGLAVRASLAAGDALAGAAALTLGLLVANGTGGGLTPGFVYASLAWPLVGLLAGHYPAYGRLSHKELAGSVTVATGGALLVASASVLLRSLEFAPTALAVALVAAVFLAPAIRALVKLGLRALHLWGRALVLLGTGPESARTARHLYNHRGLGLHPVAAFGEQGWELRSPPVTGELEHAWRYIYDNNVRHVIVAPDAARILGFDEVLRRADRQLRYVQYLPDLGGLPASSVSATPLGASVALEVRNQLASPTNRVVKRVMDVVAATILLLILAVPLALIAVLVRLDSPGSPLHRSTRAGRGGVPFSCLKFRTMFVDAETRLEQLLVEDPEAREEYMRYRKLTNDPRITRIGAVLRRLSLDELPQLVNVVIGDMSLVGPRPYLISEVADMGTHRDLIFLARPGITGYWQVEERNEATFEERQIMEADYVRNWSVWWDIEILIRTPIVMLQPNGK